MNVWQAFMRKARSRIRRWDNARMDYLNAQAAYDKAQADVNDTVINFAKWMA